MKHSVHPGPQFGKTHNREGSNPLAIHFQNKTEPKPVQSVTKAFRATKHHRTNCLENWSPFLVMAWMSTLCS